LTDPNTISIFNEVKRKWATSTIAADILIAITTGLGIIFILNIFIGLSFWWLVPTVVLLAALIIYFDQSWRISLSDVASYLDKKFPVLEESSRLLLQPLESLSPLQQLQADKIAKSIQSVEAPGKINKRIYAALGAAAISSMLVLIFSFISFNRINTESIHTKNTTNPSAGFRPAVIDNIAVTVTPPAYTRQRARSENFASISGVEGSLIRWSVKTTSPADSVELILNDVKAYSFLPGDADSTKWEFILPLKHSGFYQIVVNGKSSPLYQLQASADLPPKIIVAAPKPDLLIKYGEPRQFVLQTSITDDYGVKTAYVSATVSSGNGEAVQFKQKRLSFPVSLSAQNTLYDLKQVVRLDSLGMQPGDELYLYVLAVDNFNQETRSDVHRIILEDTAQLFSIDGLINGLDIKPEYFRSQRQIIIETEKLLRDQSKLTREEFENKSNSLGIDQKLLRLRYGKFLGEEAVTYGQGDAEQHEEGGDHDEHANESPQDVLSQFGHSHDNAEDATYFDAATKSQLRATLNEMWKAELQLRTFKPKDALPFELEALRLLKDLQQKSRVYVAKTNSKTTPLKPETRLTGELKEVVNPVFSYRNAYTPEQSEPLQKALSALQQLQLSGTYHSGTIAVLKEADKLLGIAAADEPSKYLPALSALRNIIGALNNQQTVSASDISAAQQALQAMITIPGAKPVMKEQESGTLSDYYFHQLQKGRQ
jgi:hypothetical protein